MVKQTFPTLISTTSFFRQHWLTLLCLIASCILLAEALPIIFHTTKATLSTKSTPDKKTSLNTHQQAPLSSYPLFGETIGSNNSSIETTPLNLTLIGVLNASDAKDSQAIIKIDEDDEEKLYFINEHINSNTLLWRVLDTAVLLKRNGIIERLSLPKNTLNTNASLTQALSKD